MEIREENIDQLLQARSEIDEELQRHKTKQSVLFTDIVGSTTYFDRFGDTQGLLLLYRHNALVTEAVVEFKGSVVKTIGDSVMAEFVEPLSAVHAAIAIQRRLRNQNLKQEENERLQIRIGIHSGFGFRRSNDLFGDSVNVAARITKRCGPDQIFVSQSVFEAIPASEISFQSLGMVSLEGKSAGEELFEVIWTEVEALDALHTTLTYSNPREANINGGVQPIRLGLQLPEIEQPQSTEIAHSRADPNHTSMAPRLDLVTRPGWPIPVLKTAAVFVGYLAISAGIVVSRTDARHPTVQNNSATAVSADVSGFAGQEAPDGMSVLQTSSPTEAMLSDPASVATAIPATMNAQKNSNHVAKSAVSSLGSAGVTAPAPIPALRAAVEGTDIAVDLHSARPLVPEGPAPEVRPDIKPARRTPRSNWTTLIETVPLPAAIFTMGSDTGRGDEKPGHRVKLDAIQMSQTEITNRQYLAFLFETGYPRPKDPGFAKNYLMDYPDLPVVNVSYEDAVAFCAWATKKFEAAIRLPTEAEWEYAALAGKAGMSFSWGTQDPKFMARFKKNAPLGVKTVSKDAFPPNNFGLYNMSGNVSEWVLDFYSKDYYTTSPIRNPAGPIYGLKRSIRGGSWADDENAILAMRRASRFPGDRSDDVGFRIVVADSTQAAPSNGSH
jgi:formylglycine-generating enzyme required for sulfatase activity/class 3 adenylate cyclase